MTIKPHTLKYTRTYLKRSFYLNVLIKSLRCFNVAAILHRVVQEISPEDQVLDVLNRLDH